MKRPLILIIMDGFGITKDVKKSAINHETIPYLSKIFNQYPMTLIGASALDVGLPEGQMGNSEVGHTNIGAGRVVYQDLTKITKSISDGEFYKNKVLIKAMQSAKQNSKSLHLMGLLSDGGVHSHQNHLFALVKMAKELGLKKVYVHAFLDGRDVLPTSGLQFVKDCQSQLKEIGQGEIATLMGRYYAMDRDNHWDRVEKAYNAMVRGIGKYERDPVKALEKDYFDGNTDEFIVPTVCNRDGLISSGDSIIFFNFRPDRARQITHALVDEDFNKFKREKILHNLEFVCMTQYDKSINNVNIAFEPEKLYNTFGEYISYKGLTQLRIAETEKYAHVTFFFNGGTEKNYIGEDRILIPSPKVATYDLKPEMSAAEITSTVKEKIKAQIYDVIILNFANCDMVGHSGDYAATEKAVKTVDNCVNEIVNEIIKAKGCAIITADHGNAEKMYDENGKPFTAHTTNPVPFCVVGYDCELVPCGKLSDVAPTMLEILEIEKPEDMLGKSLIKKASEI